MEPSHEDLPTIAKWRKLQWHGHVSCSSCLAKNHLARHSERGKKTRQRRRKRWEDNIKEWTGLEFSKTQRAVENREKWRKPVVKSPVVPQWPSWFRDRCWWWWTRQCKKIKEPWKAWLKPIFSHSSLFSWLGWSYLIVGCNLLDGRPADKVGGDSHTDSMHRAEQRRALSPLNDPLHLEGQVGVAAHQHWFTRAAGLGWYGQL